MGTTEFQKPRGFEDHLPEDVPGWNALEDTARDLFTSFGYREIRVPHLEYSDLFSRSIGETTDIVEKEMFTFQKEGDRNLALRPEVTASLCRALLEHHLREREPFQKLFYIGPCFRYEKPQKGRNRQFHQVGVEAIGASDPLLDVELIQLAVRYLENLGVPSFDLSLNSMGCPECRPDYRSLLKEELDQIRDDLCEDCHRRFDRNIFRILDCKNDVCRQITRDIPEITDHLCESCDEHFEEVRSGLSDFGIEYSQSPRLVRGLDYYTKTVFELKDPSLGAQDALGGGGRYDGLLEQIGGKRAGGIGFAMGMERILLSLENQGGIPHRKERDQLDLYMVSINRTCRRELLRIASKLRTKGINVDLNFEDRSLKSQMRVANRSEAPYTAILGPDERDQNEITVKQMDTGEEKRIPVDDLPSFLGKDSN